MLNNRTGVLLNVAQALAPGSRHEPVVDPPDDSLEGAYPFAKALQVLSQRSPLHSDQPGFMQCRSIGKLEWWQERLFLPACFLLRQFSLEALFLGFVIALKTGAVLSGAFRGSQGEPFGGPAVENRGVQSEGDQRHGQGRHRPRVARVHQDSPRSRTLVLAPPTSKFQGDSWLPHAIIGSEPHPVAKPAIAVQIRR